METLKHWASFQGHIILFMVLTVISKGSTCKAPSSPECFRRGRDESMYICEWSMNTTESDVTYDFYINEGKLESVKQNTTEFPEERLIRRETVHIWVRAHVGNSTCTSERRQVILENFIKYDAPRNISMSWDKDNLHLSWKAAENYPASAEVLYHRPNTISWETISCSTKTNEGTSKCQVSLSRNLTYEVMIRQKSTQAPDPLWSEWSKVVKVPAVLQTEPHVSNTLKLKNGIREVDLRWSPFPFAAEITGLTFHLTDTQSSRGCPCVEKKHQNVIKKRKHIINVTYSAVNISVIAQNAAGYSPQAVVSLPPIKPAKLEACSNPTLTDGILTKRTCLELYEYQDEVLRPENVITLSGRQKKKDRNKIKDNLKDNVRYLCYEHKCEDGKPQTVKTCLVYKKEGEPSEKPKDLNTFGETHSSLSLSWQALSTADQRGFLKHYNVCSKKLSLEKEQEVCHNISASMTQYHLENLTPATKYEISVAGVTGAGEGPRATVLINTLPEKSFHVWWSLGLVVVFFLFSTMCTFVLKRIKIKIFPPVPTPIIDFKTHPREIREMQERKEEVHQLTLHRLIPEGKCAQEVSEERVQDEWDDSTDEGTEHERGDSRMSREISDEGADCTDETVRSSREGQTTDLQQLENELAMLIYKNGLVFDVKTESL